MRWTLSSSAQTWSCVCAFVRAMPWIRSGLPMWYSTLWIGFSDENGSWKTICTSRRYLRSLRRPHWTGSPRQQDLPGSGRLQLGQHAADGRFAGTALPTIATTCPWRVQRDVVNRVDHLARPSEILTRFERTAKCLVRSLASSAVSACSGPCRAGSWLRSGRFFPWLHGRCLAALVAGRSQHATRCGGSPGRARPASRAGSWRRQISMT